MKNNRIVFYRNEIEKSLFKQSTSSFDSARVNLLKSMNRYGRDTILLFNYPLFKYADRPKWSNKVIFLPTIDLRILSFISKSLFLFIYCCYQVIFKNANVLVTDLEGVFGLLPLIFLRSLSTRKILIQLDIRSMSVENENRSFISKTKEKIALKIAANYFNSASFTTRESADKIEKEYGVKFKDKLYYPSGVNTKLFYPNGSKEYQDDREFIIVYHGSISPTRGLDDLIKSMAILKNKNLSLKLIVLGVSDTDIILNDFLRIINDIIIELRLQNIVELRKPVPHDKVPEVIRECHLGVVPIQDKHWWIGQSPLKLLEYLSCGIPVVASKINCNQTVLKNSISGIYYEAGNINDLAHKIEQIYNEYHNEFNSYIARANEGRKIAVDNYSYENIALELINYFDEKLLRIK